MSLRDNVFRQGRQQRGPIKASTIRGLQVAVDRLTTGAEPPRNAAPLATPGRSKRFQLVSVENDYLVAVVLDGAGAGALEYKIAKPYLLRRSPFDGNSRNGVSYSYTNNTTRTASKAGETDITEVVVPYYVAGDELYASRVFGGTGVTVDGVDLVFLDDNRDARAWAEQPE